MAAIMEVDEGMRKNFLQFEPAPRRGEPEARYPKPYAWLEHAKRFSALSCQRPGAVAGSALALNLYAGLGHRTPKARGI